MVRIVPLVGLSAFEVVFKYFSHGFVMFSYGLNRTPRWYIGFRICFRMFPKVSVWF